MKRKHLFVILICAFLLTAGLTAIFYSINMASKEVVDLREINISFEVGMGTGFSVDTDRLNMGRIEPGRGGNKRSIFLNHKETEPLLVVIDLEGDIGQWVGIDPNNFILEPNMTQEVFFSVSVPVDSEIRNYTGTVKVYFITD